MKEPKIDVAIMHSERVEFVLYGDFNSPNFDNLFNGKVSAKLQNGKIILITDEGEFDPKDEILLNPLDPASESFLLKDVIIGLKFHWEQKQNQRFSGSLKIIIEKDLLTVVNVIPLEEYLTSVISSEMSATSSPEMLKAHAIISRSWLLSQIGKRSAYSGQTRYQSETRTEDEIIKWYDREDHVFYDVCADDHCQRYQGITKTHAHNAKQAVDDTKGLVLIFMDQICDARYSKACGGVTEVFENVWEDVEHPYLQRVTDYKYDPDGYVTDLSKEEDAVKWIKNSPAAFCNTADEKILDQVLNYYDRKTKNFFRWEAEYTQTEIADLISNKSGIEFGDILDLIPLTRGYSGRIIKLKIVGSIRTLTIGKELEIRKILSESHLYSSAFIVKKIDPINGIPQKFILRGAGWGHGVGLCQIGAAVMGEVGYHFDEILLHYFKGAAIKNVYD